MHRGLTAISRSLATNSCLLVNSLNVTRIISRLHLHSPRATASLTGGHIFANKRHFSRESDDSWSRPVHQAKKKNLGRDKFSARAKWSDPETETSRRKKPEKRNWQATKEFTASDILGELAFDSTFGSARMSSKVAMEQANGASSPRRENNNRQQGKRPHPGNGQKQGGKKVDKKARKRERDMGTGTHEEVLAFDIDAVLKQLDETRPVSDTPPALPEKGTEIEVEVLEISSTGDALTVQKDSMSRHIYVTPFAVPGDVVKVKVWRAVNDKYTEADYLSIVSPSPLRDDSRIKCGYFTKCSGCQFQMLDYSEQLKHKKRIVERAFKNFSQLPPELIPTIGDTIGSPLQYGYRTKLTPHFDGPPGHPRKASKRNPLQSRPEIGFMQKGTRKTLDIEDCPIGTDAVRMGMKSERERMDKEYGNYIRGATILLRESTQRIYKDGCAPTGIIPQQADQQLPDASNAVISETERFTDYKTCVTDNKGTSTEYIDDYIFYNPAGSFFQNNNSILPSFTDYIRQNILPRDNDTSERKIKNLIDAYSGSGLFTITLSNLFSGHATGIDIADASIAFARRNAAANGRPEEQTNFIAADAAQLFKSVSNDTYHPDETVVVLDPPRKGCDASFLGQLMQFGPRRIVYVSCNVHTQARDIGCLVRGDVSSMLAEGEENVFKVEDPNQEGGKKGGAARYEMEALRGFDFFPQSAHVEGVAVLNRVDDV